MRVWALALALVAGCTFTIDGMDVPASGAAPGSAADPGTPPVADTPVADTPAPTPDAAAPDPAPAPPPDMAQALVVGTPCTANADCATGLVCGKSFNTAAGVVKVPGGYCTLDCSNATCPTGSFCGSFSFGKFCLSDCPPDPCRKGYQCCQNSGQKGCTPDQLCPG